jgi:hypothetical protein
MNFFLVNFFLLNITFLSFVFSIFKKRHSCIYFIVFKGKTLKDIIDNRANVYCNLAKLPNNICFIRCFNLKSALKLFTKYQNVFVINSLEYFFSKKLTQFFIKQILSIYKINKFSMLDDYRYLNLFLPICRDLKVASYGYMHGRFSKSLKFQSSLFKNKFDKYFVWSNFFKKKFLKLNSLYRDEDIVVLKKFKSKFYFKNNSFKNNKINILFLQENRISENEFLPLVKKLKNEKDYNFYYKIRPNNSISEILKQKLEINKIEVLKIKNLKMIIISKKINFVFGFNSSFMYIAPLLNIIPISINNIFLLKDLKNDGIVNLIEVKKNKIKNQINLLHKNEKKHKLLKEKIWA